MSLLIAFVLGELAGMGAVLFAIRNAVVVDRWWLDNSDRWESVRRMETTSSGREATS